MNCSCPKCNANIDIPVEDISSQGGYSTCPVCKARFWVQLESFINRAYARTGQIFCAKCGHRLGTELICLKCNAIYPDYCMVQNSKPPRRQSEGSFSLPDFSAGLSSKRTQRQTSGGAGSALWLKAVIVLVIVALIGAAGFVYMGRRAEQVYVGDCVKAMYFINAASERSFASMAKLATDWQAAVSAGRSGAFVPSAKELAALDSANVEIERQLLKLKTTPEAYATLRQDIDKMNAEYQKLCQLNKNIPNAPAELDVAVTEARSSYNSLVTDIRQRLPGRVAEEIRKSTAKYRYMEVFLE